MINASADDQNINFAIAKNESLSLYKHLDAMEKIEDESLLIDLIKTSNEPDFQVKTIKRLNKSTYENDSAIQDILIGILKDNKGYETINAMQYITDKKLVFEYILIYLKWENNVIELNGADMRDLDKLLRKIPKSHPDINQEDRKVARDAINSAISNHDLCGRTRGPM